MKNLEKLFESFLWNSRFVVLAAVITSLVASLAMFYIATVDAIFMVSHLPDYLIGGLPDEERAELRASTVTHVVEIVDGYLLATIMLIFALGLYELFISKIDQAETEEGNTASNVLIIHDLDDLKTRLGKVILMILIVLFFEKAVEMHFEGPLDLLELAGGIALVGLAMYLSHAGEKGKH
jgi:uncharacterized membrane protein YqhA